MKRANNLISEIIEPENLRLAFWKAQRGKSQVKSIAIYRKNLDDNLLKLRQEIISGNISVGNYHFFKIYDPKERKICASAFGERVLHHGLMNICHDNFDRFQIFHSYASRLGKGVHLALKHAQKFSRQNQWFLKLDVQKFFGSIDHEILKIQLRKRFKEHKLLYIFEQIIDSYQIQGAFGLPIGNLTSQYFANHYLAVLDHFIKERLKCKAYVRYMDDMVLWHQSKDFLKDAWRSIDYYLNNELKCKLKPILLNKVERGLPFCGYLIRPQNIRLSQRSKKRYIRKMKKINKKYESGEWSEAKCQRSALPLIAFTHHADACEFRKKVLGDLL